MLERSPEGSITGLLVFRGEIVPRLRSLPDGLRIGVGLRDCAVDVR